MSWQLLLFLYMIGFATTAVVVSIAGAMGIRYYRELQKMPLAVRYERLDELVAEKQVQYDELREQLRIANSTIDYAEELKQKATELEERLKDLQPQEDKLREIEDKLPAKMEQCEQLEERIRELSASEEKLLHDCMKMDETLAQQTELEQSIKTLTDQQTAIGSAIHEIEQERERVQNDVDSLKKEVLRLKDEVQRLEKEFDTLQEQLQIDSAKLNEAREEHARRKMELGGLEQQIRDAESRCKNLQEQVLQLTTQIDKISPQKDVDPEDRVKSVWDPTLVKADFKEPNGENGTDEGGYLRRATDYFAQENLRFHERVIKAFHTSLKVSNESPLLVLAGISGTGKSALPRHYAKAMGMHFLNVAVQPSWDSPMDLLGFYNYLENRYKPTELARALVQMDRFGKEDGRWPESRDGYTALDDRMLLVLLDEMNLARIEYYFSEFLSRLETRRDLTKDEMQILKLRRDAEVPLEIGGSIGGGHQALPLFVDTNVLFVGTMNEDESTQTLSDKVVDRANIMRFGKPRNLEVEAQAGEGNPADQYLPYELWQSWLKDGYHQTLPNAETVSKWIDECNTALTQIGRPFGYRTANAMRNYIKLYPGSIGDEHVLRLAMADQVEQRILPKLRGIDLMDDTAQYAVQAVHNLVRGDLEDATLADAIESGRQGHHFAWQGIDRATE